MFEHTIGFITSRTQHPFIASLFGLAALFAVVGVLVEIFSGNGTAAGFLVIYAMMAAAIGAFGYVVLYILKFASMIRERTVAT